jgi:hypothetical protein
VCLASFLDLPGLVRQHKVLAQCQKEGRVLIRGHHPIAGLAERPIQAQSAYSRVAGWGRLAHAKLAAIRPAAARMVAEEMRVVAAVGLMSAEATGGERTGVVVEASVAPSVRRSVLCRSIR